MTDKKLLSDALAAIRWLAAASSERNRLPTPKTDIEARLEAAIRKQSIKARVMTKTVFVEHQPEDKCYAVYVGGDDDAEGEHDSLFSYGVFWPKTITADEARSAAQAYAKEVAKKIQGEVCSGVVYT